MSVSVRVYCVCVCVTHSVAADGCEHKGVSFFAVPVELHSEQRLAVILLHDTHIPVREPSLVHTTETPQAHLPSDC